MADILTQIQEYETKILNAVANFIFNVTKLPVFMLDKPFIKPETPYIGIKIIAAGSSNGWSSLVSYQNDTYGFLMDNSINLEIRCYRGRPLAVLNYLLAAFMGFEEAKYTYMYSQHVGFLSSTQVTDFSSMYDGDKTENRAMMVITLNSPLIAEDLELPPQIEFIDFTVNAYTPDYEGTKISIEGEFIYTT